MSKPTAHRSHWTGKGRARALGLAIATVHGIRTRHGLKPHPITTVTVSNDPRFGITAPDGIGLARTPPDPAARLSVDATPPIPALGRTPTPRPPAPGHAATRTHDDRRTGTTPLRAALDGATGTGVGRRTQRPRSEDVGAVLDPGAVGIAPEAEVPGIRDTRAAHKSALVHAGLADHPPGLNHWGPSPSRPPRPQG